VKSGPQIRAVYEEQSSTLRRREKYKAMFGMPAHVGLERTGLPADLCKTLEEEDQLEEALQGLCCPSDRSDGEDEDSEDNVAPPSPHALLDRRKEVIKTERVAAKKGLVQQAKRMRRDSDAKFPPPEDS